MPTRRHTEGQVYGSDPLAVKTTTPSSGGAEPPGLRARPRACRGPDGRLRTSPEGAEREAIQSGIDVQGKSLLARSPRRSGQPPDAAPAGSFSGSTSDRPPPPL